MNYKKPILWLTAVLLAVFITATVGGSFYMLDYALSPAPYRTDTSAYFRQQFEEYPETRPWVDSLRRIGALRDTFITTDGRHERQHAYYVSRGSRRTAIAIHGWRDNAVEFFYLARLYERELGYNVVMPDLHAHGLSEGDAISMGWLDRKDVMQWLRIFQTDTMVVHGVSMGGATTMMTSAEKMPEGVRDIRFVDDCGYTSVWDQFAKELREQFGLPAFPLMYSSSLLCRWRYGWSFGEASAIGEVASSPYPMLFIHGDSDKFVPTEMARRLYDAKPSHKSLWITKGTPHAHSYYDHREEYIRRIRAFVMP